MSDLISRREAIDEIKALYEWHDTVTEDRTIDHLKRLPSAQPTLQPTCNKLATDTISRKAAISELMEWVEKEKNKSWSPFKGLFHWTGIKAMLECLPPAQPEIEERKEESAQNVPKEDLISRKAAIDVLATMQGLCTSKAALVQNSKIWQQIKDLPSAQPKRKTGRWLIREGISDAQCSECGMYFNDVYDMDNSDAFCRHCGAKMEGLKVVEDERFDQQTGGD